MLIKYKLAEIKLNKDKIIYSLQYFSFYTVDYNLAIQNEIVSLAL